MIHSSVTKGIFSVCVPWLVLSMDLYGDAEKKKNKRSSRCEFFQSIRKHTFFFKSHLSLFQIVSFSYLWLKNVSLSFIMEQISISENTAVDWAAFHREVVFDCMVIRHEEIGEFVK